MNLTILDTGLARKDPYVIIDENEKVLAASYEENGEHSKSGLLRLTDELATLRAQLAEAREVIKPFIHEDLCSQLAGNTIGEKSIVFGRDKAELTLGDFRAARAWYNKVITA